MTNYTQDSLFADIKKVTRLLQQFSPFFYVVPFKVITDDEWKEKIGGTYSTPTAAATAKGFFFAESFMKDLPENKRLGLLLHEVMHPALMHLSNPWIDRTIPVRMFQQLRNIAQDRVIESSIFFLSGELSPHNSKQGFPVADETARLICQQHSDEAVLEADRHKSWRDVYDEMRNSPNMQKMLQQMKEIDAHIGFGEDGDQNVQSQWAAATEEANSIIERLRSTKSSNMNTFKVEVVEPALPWSTIMRNHLQQIPSKVHKSWKRVQRRPFAIHHKYVPIMTGTVNALESVQMWVDTSGSMMGDLNACAAEVSSLLWQLGCKKLTLIEYDTHVHGNQVIEIDEGGVPFKIKEFHGNGGTDIRACIQELIEKEELPDSSIPMIVLTDGGDRYNVAEHLRDFNITWVSFSGKMEPDMGSVVYTNEN